VPGALQAQRWGQRLRPRVGAGLPCYAFPGVRLAVESRAAPTRPPFPVAVGAEAPSRYPSPHHRNDPANCGLAQIGKAHDARFGEAQREDSVRRVRVHTRGANLPVQNGYVPGSSHFSGTCHRETEAVGLTSRVLVSRDQ
jgi:hypothetical protein